MYNIIFKSVAYLSIITSFFIIILCSGITRQDTYYTWTDKNGVTQITRDQSDIPVNSIKKSKKVNKTEHKSFINKLNTLSESYKNTLVYFLFGLISIFMILILSKELNRNLVLFLRDKNTREKQKNIRNSGILKLTNDHFSEISLQIMKKMGFELEVTDNYLKSIVEYTGNKDGNKYTVSIIFSDNPVSKLTINEIFREGAKFNCSNFIIISNNYFLDEVKEYENELNTILIDRDKIAELILKYKINQQ